MCMGQMESILTEKKLFWLHQNAARIYTLAIRYLSFGVTLDVFVISNTLFFDFSVIWIGILKLISGTCHTANDQRFDGSARDNSMLISSTIANAHIYGIGLCLNNVPSHYALLIYVLAAGISNTPCETWNYLSMFAENTMP